MTTPVDDAKTEYFAGAKSLHLRVLSRVPDSVSTPPRVFSTRNASHTHFAND
jgi:hypothetical protein